MIAENFPAPDFTLPDQDGRLLSLSDFRGFHVVVFFYPADDTPVCTKEACALRDGYADLRASNTVVLGVSPDDGASHRKFRAKYNLPFALLSDPEKVVLTAWGAWGEKTLYGNKVTGVLRSTVVIGPDGLIKKHIKRVDTAKAALQGLPYLK
ncbi:MAG: peroxiredoxin [Spirochaetales bacterium]